MELRDAYATELLRHRELTTEGDRNRAWAHLERAHILSQRHLLRHFRVHLLMLRHGVSGRDHREVRGQFVRLLAVPVAWATGWVPEGNTGGADVSALLPMEPPDDLRHLVEGRGPWWRATRR